jgi:catechol 2,3-dioxygenase-like lactoylglutathione lyase family enzyme
MEHVISKLLDDFEQGKLTRRQFVQSIAFLATAAPAVAKSAPPFQAIAVNHISYEVRDYRKIRDFYAELLGMNISHDNGRECYLSFGDSFLIPRNHAGNTPRIDHVAYTIDNWDRNKVEAELKRRGLKPRPDTENSFHVKDPDGFDLQIAGKEMKP